MVSLIIDLTQLNEKKACRAWKNRCDDDMSYRTEWGDKFRVSTQPYSDPPSQVAGVVCRFQWFWKNLRGHSIQANTRALAHDTGAFQITDSFR